MAKIDIYIARHVCTAPRPQKEAAALAEAGHDVTVHGVWFDPVLVARDEELLRNARWRFHPIVDGRPLTASHRRRWWQCRLQHRLARQLYARAGILLPDTLGYAVGRMAAHASRRAADLAIFHSEGGLWIADRLRRRGRRVAIDFEDWFSRDLLPSANADRPVRALAALECSLLRGAAYCVTTSHALADALADASGGPKPAVLYNTFPLRSPGAPTGQDRVDPACVSLHWFSLVCGPGRGLETLAASLQDVAGRIEVHLRGDGPADYRAHLRSLFPAAHRERVFFHPTVSNAELPARIAQHDIGLALDLTSIPSRNLTITNKLFQYLIGGLATLATDTAGHREILDQVPDAGGLFPAEDSRALGALLRRYVEQPALLAAARQAARRAAEERFAHEHQESRYAELVATALARPVKLAA